MKNKKKMSLKAKKKLALVVVILFIAGNIVPMVAQPLLDTGFNVEGSVVPDTYNDGSDVLPDTNYRDILSVASSSEIDK